MNSLPQNITEFVQSCASCAQKGQGWEELAQSVPAMRKFVEGSMGTLERFSWTIIWSDSVKRLVNMGLDNIDIQREALNRVERACREQDARLLQEWGLRFELASDTLSLIWQELYRLDQEGDFYSNFPVLDKLIKCVINVRQGLLKKQPLAFLFPASALYVMRLGSSVKRFTLYYGENSVGTKARKAIADLEAALGAVDQFVRKDSREALSDSLHLLTAGSEEMYESTRSMVAYAESKRKYARHSLVEEVYRAREVNLQGDDLQLMWRGINSAIQLEVNRVQYISEHPLRELVNLNTPVLKARAVAVAEYLNGLDKTNLASLDLGYMDELIFTFTQEVALSIKGLESCAAAAEGAGNFEDLMLMAGLYLLGEMDSGSLMKAIDDQRDLLLDLSEDIDRDSMSMDPEVFEKLYSLLTVQNEGLLNMSEGVSDRNPDLLRRGWQMIRETLPESVALSRSMRQSITGNSNDDGVIACLNCGHRNPSLNRYCEACNARLLRRIAQGNSYNVRFEDDDTPGNVMHLQALVSNVQHGDADQREVQDVILTFLDSAATSKYTFQTQILPSLEKLPRDSAAAERIQLFADNIELYISGLQYMLGYVDVPDVSYLHRGLEQCRQAAKNLVALSAEEYDE